MIKGNLITSVVKKRLRIFLFSLDPMRWIAPPDRSAIYAAQICSAAVLKAAASVDLAAVPAAFPLPYGEYLGEVEALQLILAHDLYNELRNLIASVQEIPAMRSLPVVLLVMMAAVFTPTPSMREPGRVVRVHDFYVHKLQVCLPLFALFAK